VRPDSHQRSLLIRYLNAGADGLMVPMVDTAGQARAIVDAVRYACPADHEKRLVVSMIETLDAIGNIDSLLAVEGIDVFFIGPSDLSQSMGYPGNPKAPPVAAAIEHALATIRAAGKAPGMPATAESLATVIGNGCRYIYTHLPRILGAGAMEFLGKAGR